ncbi:MAG: DUF2299 family protein [Acidobacteriaceae bacterium]
MAFLFRPHLICGYAAAGVACLSIILFAFTGQAVLSKKQPQTTGGNIEANVRAWTDSLGLGIKKERAPETDFLLLITLANGTTVGVFKAKERSKYLSFQVNIGFSSEHSSALGKLSVNQIEVIARDLTLELSRINIGYKLVGPPFTAIMLLRGMPIGSSITEATFAACLDQMDNATQVAKVAFALALEKETAKINLLASQPS